jgi:hypothetical protein
VDETGSGSCSVAGFGVSCVEPLDSATAILVMPTGYGAHVSIFIHAFCHRTQILKFLIALIYVYQP